MPEVAVGPVTLRYELGGDPSGPRTVLVSGTGSDLRAAPGAFDTGWAEGLRLLAYDHRGLGRSTVDAATPGPTMADFAGDLLGLLDHLGWDTCRVLGISFGGMVALEAAVTAPERVERLALVCTSAGGASGASYPLHELEDLDAEERIARWVAALDVRAADDPRRRAALSSIMEQRRATKPTGPDTTAGELAQLLARADHDVHDRLGRLTMPVLIAAGRYDGIAPPANQEALRAAIPHAELHWFEGGHGFFLEDPAAVPTVTAWLRRP